MSWTQGNEVHASLLPRTSVKTHRVSISTAAVRIGTIADRKRLFLTHSSSLTLWVGGSDVSTANGFPVPSGAVFPVPVTSDIVIWGIASGSIEVSVMELT